MGDEVTDLKQAASLGSPLGTRPGTFKWKYKVWHPKCAHQPRHLRKSWKAFPEIASYLVGLQT